MRPVYDDAYERQELINLGFNNPQRQFERFYDNPISFTSQYYFCPVPLRLDTYSGCAFNCCYCFANNSNQKYMNNTKKKAGDFVDKEVIPTRYSNIKKYFDVAFNGKKNTFKNQEAIAIQCLQKRVPLHFGGMSDPLQALEKDIAITYMTLKLLKKYQYPVILSSKSNLLLDKRYIDLIKDYDNFALQISLIDDRNEVINLLEPNASNVEERLSVIKEYSNMGKWVGVRIQPFIINLSESRIISLLDKIKATGAKHVMVEGLKFFSGNKDANKKISSLISKFNNTNFDMSKYYKAIGAVHSGNDLELPSKIKSSYVNVFKNEIKKRGMTFGAADNDLRTEGDSPCCCGVENLKGFENLIKHNTGFAIFDAIRNNKKSFTYDDIKDYWFPEGKFRVVKSNEELKKKFGENSTYKDAEVDIKEAFLKAWNKGLKNSPCDVCCIKKINKNFIISENKKEEKITKQTFLDDYYG